jgi:hypothetical protein
LPWVIIHHTHTHAEEYLAHFEAQNTPTGRLRALPVYTPDIECAMPFQSLAEVERTCRAHHWGSSHDGRWRDLVLEA